MYCLFSRHVLIVIFCKVKVLEKEVFMRLKRRVASPMTVNVEMATVFLFCFFCCHQPHRLQRNHQTTKSNLIIEKQRFDSIFKTQSTLHQDRKTILFATLSISSSCLDKHSQPSSTSHLSIQTFTNNKHQISL